MSDGLREKAAKAARAYQRGERSWKELVDEFHSSGDAVVDRLAYIAQREPQRGGLFDVDETDWESALEGVTRALEGRAPVEAASLEMTRILRMNGHTKAAAHLSALIDKLGKEVTRKDAIETMRSLCHSKAHLDLNMQRTHADEWSGLCSRLHKACDLELRRIGQG